MITDWWMFVTVPNSVSDAVKRPREAMITAGAKNNRINEIRKTHVWVLLITTFQTPLAHLDPPKIGTNILNHPNNLTRLMFCSITKNDR